MPRFFADIGSIAGGSVRLGREDARHMAVLRLKPGDAVTICDGQGTDYRCFVDNMEKDAALLNIAECIPSEGEPPIQITIFQGLPKSGKMELIIQKCVELGACEIVPVVTERSIPRLKDKGGAKTARWQALAKAAAMQSERGVIPRVGCVVDLCGALELAARLDVAYVAYENERHVSLRQMSAREGGGRRGIFIGPEGGFSEAEIDVLRRRGVAAVSLGPRVLRTETAGFAALIIMLYV